MDGDLNRLRSELAGRYEIQHELGHGGMAVVYLAKDLKHDRRVAIKVLRADLGADSADRFLREIRTVAQLHHPHILGLHDSGTAGGQPFYVMPHVDGETLRQRLERSGQLSVDEAVRIAREVADALEYAHARGIVHRDIKPENIFLSAGHALVGDFGIARAADAAGLKFTTLTEAGLAVGTPAYMSPEQATADPKVDGRSDQYALGCVLYEMLAGQPPFKGPTSQAVMARHTSDAVPPLATVRAIPPSLEVAITKSLAKMPADRWPSARTFANELDRSLDTRTGAEPSPASRPARRRTAIVVGVSVVALILAVWLGSRWASGDGSTRAGALPALTRVGVMPFGFRGEDTTQRLIADGLNEWLKTALVPVEGLSLPDDRRVRADSRVSSDPVEFGKVLQVDVVLSADVVVSGNGLRVTAQLTDVKSGEMTWRRLFVSPLVLNDTTLNLFDVTDSIAVDIVGKLMPEVAPERRAMAARGSRTNDPEAIRLYLLAKRSIGAFTRPGVEQGIKLLEQALLRDSLFADAWIALAEAYESMAEVWPGGAERGAEIAVAWRDAVDRGLELDSANGNAFAQRGFYRLTYLWDWDRAQADYRRAIQLAPASVDVAGFYAAFLNFAAESDSALTHMRRAVQMDPVNPALWAALGLRSMMASAPDSALAASAHALQLDSLYWAAYYVRVHALFASGRRLEADSAATTFHRLSSGSPFVQALLADYYRRTGNVSRAREILSSLRERARREYVPPARIGAVLLALGDRAGALDALEQSARNRDLNLMWDMSSQYYSLAGNSRFDAVRRKVYRNSRSLPANLFGEPAPALRN